MVAHWSTVRALLRLGNDLLSLKAQAADRFEYRCVDFEAIGFRGTCGHRSVAGDANSLGAQPLQLGRGSRLKIRIYCCGKERDHGHSGIDRMLA